MVVWGTSDSLYLLILTKVCSEIHAFIMCNYLPIILILTALTNRTIATMAMTPPLPSRQLMQQHFRHYHTDKMFPVQRGYLSRIVCFKRGLQASSWWWADEWWILHRPTSELSKPSSRKHTFISSILMPINSRIYQLKFTSMQWLGNLSCHQAGEEEALVLFHRPSSMAIYSSRNNQLLIL